MDVGLFTVGIALSLAVSGLSGVSGPPVSQWSIGSNVSAAVAIEEPRRFSPTELVREWDRNRRAAWEQMDERALRNLYAANSPAGKRDVGMLTAWNDRGVRPVGWRTSIRSAEVLASSRARIVMCVVDRLVGGRAVGRGMRFSLPRDRWTSHIIEFQSTQNGWVVGDVEPQRACYLVRVSRSSAAGSRGGGLVAGA